MLKKKESKHIVYDDHDNTKLKEGVRIVHHVFVSSGA